MDNPQSPTPPPSVPNPEQPAWYDFLIELLKKLLETSNFRYGLKKKF